MFFFRRFFFKNEKIALARFENNETSQVFLIEVL